MKIKFEEDFFDSLRDKLIFIAKDNPVAAKKFRKELINKCQNILNMPYKHRKSIYHDDENIRDLIFKGYTIIYIVEDESIIIFALIHHEKYTYNQG